MSVTVDAGGNVASYDDYYPFGMTMDGRSGNIGNGDARIGKFLSVDPHSSLYYSLSLYCYAANNPLAFVDPKGMDSVFFQDQTQRPPDNGTPGTSYTANIFVVQNGEIVGVYFGKGSTYPNSVSESGNSPMANTVDEGGYPFNNESGNSSGTRFESCRRVWLSKGCCVRYLPRRAES